MSENTSLFALAALITGGVLLVAGWTQSSETVSAVGAVLVVIAGVVFAVHEAFHGISQFRKPKK